MVPTVRAVMPGDFDAIAAITNHYILTTPIHFGYEPIAPEALRSQWEKGRDLYPWLASVTGAGEVLAYAKAGVWRVRAAYAWTAEAGIYVREDSHGRGIGRTLYAALIADLRARGFHSVVGGITLPNAGSVRLHESLGFAPVGVVRHAGYKNNQWHDVGFWQLMLGEGKMVK